MLAITLNEIHLIDGKTGRYQALKIPQVEIRGVSWKDNKTVSYSIKDKNKWRIQYYNIDTHQVTAKTNNWKYIRYTQTLTDTIWQNQSGNIFFGAKRQIISDDELLQVKLLNGRTFNLKKYGLKWAWQERVKGIYQLMIRENLATKRLISTDSYHFDLSKNGVLFHTQENLTSDIYQTISE